MTFSNRSFCAGLALLTFVALPTETSADVRGWLNWRGPQQDGTSNEKNLPDKWAINGENFIWHAPYGGRSTPIVMGNHVCVQNP